MARMMEIGYPRKIGTGPKGLGSKCACVISEIHNGRSYREQTDQVLNSFTEIESILDCIQWLLAVTSFMDIVDRAEMDPALRNTG